MTPGKRAHPPFAVPAGNVQVISGCQSGKPAAAGSNSRAQISATRAARTFRTAVDGVVVVVVVVVVVGGCVGGDGKDDIGDDNDASISHMIVVWRRSL